MRFLSLLVVLALAACSSLQTPAEDTAENPGAYTRFGTYLAARVADEEQDAESATILLTRVLADDPSNASVLQRTLIESLAAGRIDIAANAARALVEIRPGHGLAHLTLACIALHRDDLKSAGEEIDKVTDGPTVLIAPLIKAWILAAQNHSDLALARLAEMERRGNLTELATYHEALLQDMTGDLAGANRTLTKLATETTAPLRVLEAYGNLLERQGYIAEARKLYASALEKLPENPAFTAAFKRLEGPVRRMPHPIVSNPREGAAEALYGIGGGLSQDGVQDIAMVYLQLALTVNPDHAEARLAIADLEIAADQPEQAIGVLNKVTRASAYYLPAQLEIATAWMRADRLDDAIPTLQSLARMESTSPQPLLALGDLYREHERFEEAATAYTQAIARSTDQPGTRDWQTYFARGVCLERLGRWSESEADLEHALALNPKDSDAALVLNYLGYSLLDRGEEPERARDLIQRAAQLRPNDGFIIDSLGWLQYRSGEYRTAVETLERAVELKPRDPTINHHLGDAYWKTGRRLEARFQWSHALGDKPDAEEEAALRQKLELGLDNAEKVIAQRQERH